MSPYEPGIFIFDIDGTLANNEHREHYLYPPKGQKKDWVSFFRDQYLDTVFEPIAVILRALFPYYKIILLTGRPEEERLATKIWLDKYAIPYRRLIMRPIACKEDDTTLKGRLLRMYLTASERKAILTIFEDRRRVVTQLRIEGYHVCHVANGDF